jgi:ADP-heptose:LPS heptosyltransferase
MRIAPKRVLIIRVGRLGDTILATPVIGVLKQAFGQDVMIDFVASPGASTAILELDRRINDVFPLARRRLPWRLHPVKRMLRKRSRSIPYDLVINLECGIECDDFIEFIKTGEFCGRPQVHPQHIPGRHCVDTEKTIYASRLGPEITAAADPSLETGPDLEHLPSLEDADYVVLNPGFSGILRNDYRNHRSWPMECWADLIEFIRQGAGLEIAINGTEEEREFFEPLLALPGVLPLFGSSLQLLIHALSRARCLVSVDTGTMHLSTALGTPTIALFGPTNPELTGPYSRKVPHSVLSSGIDCQPCIRTPEQKRCRVNRCMQELKSDVVYKATEQMIRLDRIG